jgi:ABC-type oligopeptide transport system substrate-binding subunit
MFMIEIQGNILENKANQGRKSMEAITKKTLEEVFEKTLPWFMLFKILQTNKPTHERVTFKNLRNMFKDFFKMLNILHCVLTFSEVKFTRKTTWTNFHGK